MSRLEDTLIPNANTVYDSNHTVIATLTSTTDTNQFCNTYNHDNKYNGLKLGSIINIYDGSSYTRWYIAGFDVEYNKIASDGSTYDNGYGIALVPETQLTEEPWYSPGSGYISSTMHTATLPTIANNLKKVLGNHLVNRNVLLSSSVSSSNGSTAYTWTTAYCTLMSIGQMTGTFASHNNKYDDGEANYKLPLFNYMDYWTGNDFLSRGIYSSGYFWIVYSGGTISNGALNGSYGVRPLIYIR